MTPPIFSPASLDRLIQYVEGFLVPGPQNTRDVRSVVTATIGELSRKGVVADYVHAGEFDEVSLRTLLRVIEALNKKKVAPRLMEISEAADYLRCSESTLRTWAKKEIIPGPVEGTYRYDKDAIDYALDKASGIKRDSPYDDGELTGDDDTYR